MVCSVLVGCGSEPLDPNADLRNEFELQTLGSIEYPPDNPNITSRIELGRLLFFDPILSGEKDVACGTCHHPDFTFADGRQFGAGVSGIGLGSTRTLSVSAVTGAAIQEEPRNSQSIMNLAFATDVNGAPTHTPPLFWDGRAMGLEEQALLPIASRNEMRGDAFPGTEEEAAAAAVDSIVQRIEEISEYVDLFRSAFAQEGADTATTVVTRSRLSRALAAYQRELNGVNSPYDQFVRGDDDALSDEAKRGLRVFFTTGKCTLCHRGAMFSNFLFRVTGSPQEGPGKLVIPGDDTGREEHTGQLEDRYAFRVPSLRNVAATAPYMHAGVFDTLDDVLRFYNDGAQPRNPNVPDASVEVSLRTPLGLTDEEIADVIAFLQSLTDPGIALPISLTSVPTAVPSGLTPVFGLGTP